MRRRLAYVLVPFAVLGLSAGLMSGCKQKVGERCQIDSDCDTDLVCNTGTGVCQPKGQGSVDAVPPPDAPVDGPDAGPVDAPSPDAMPIDAMPTDARPVDAT